MKPRRPAAESFHTNVTRFAAVGTGSAYVKGMTANPRGLPVSLLMKRSGISFYTRRVLQRWLRGEITTDTAVELIQSDDAARITGMWTNSGA